MSINTIIENFELKCVSQHLTDILVDDPPGSRVIGHRASARPCQQRCVVAAGDHVSGYEHPFWSYMKSQCNPREDALDESTGRLEEIFVQGASGADVIIYCSRGRE